MGLVRRLARRVRSVHESACASHADGYDGRCSTVSGGSYFRDGGAGGSYRIGPEPLVQVRLTSPADEAVRSVREILRHAFGSEADAAFLSVDRQQVHVYVTELTDPLLDLVFSVEDELAKALPRRPELRVVAHQGRRIPSERDGMDRVF